MSLRAFSIYVESWPEPLHDEAIFIGRSEGTDFKDACQRFFTLAQRNGVPYVTPDCYDPDTNSYAGLPLHDGKGMS